MSFSILPLITSISSMTSRSLVSPRSPSRSVLMLRQPQSLAVLHSVDLLSASNNSSRRRGNPPLDNSRTPSMNASSDKSRRTRLGSVASVEKASSFPSIVRDNVRWVRLGRKQLPSMSIWCILWYLTSGPYTCKDRRWGWWVEVSNVAGNASPHNFKVTSRANFPRALAKASISTPSVEDLSFSPDYHPVPNPHSQLSRVYACLPSSMLLWAPSWSLQGVAHVLEIGYSKVHWVPSVWVWFMSRVCKWQRSAIDEGDSLTFEYLRFMYLNRIKSPISFGKRSMCTHCTCCRLHHMDMDESRLLGWPSNLIPPKLSVLSNSSISSSTPWMLSRLASLPLCPPPQKPSIDLFLFLVQLAKKEKNIRSKKSQRYVIKLSSA